jgi:predicted DNA-binding protein
MSKHFSNVTGKVIGVRLPENVYVLLARRAEKLGKTVSEYGRVLIEREVCRSHHGKR